jgi:hypothetical protein
VDDPDQVPADVDALARHMDAQLQELQASHDLTPTEAAQHVLAVIDQFQELAVSDAVDPTQ